MRLTNLTAFLWGCVLTLSHTLPPALLLALGASIRSHSWVFGVLLGLILQLGYSLLHQYAFVTCCDDGCHWEHHLSPISFLIRDAPVLDRVPQVTVPSQSDELYQTHWARTQAFEAFVLGKNSPDNAFSCLYTQFGLAHLLCLSAWHVGFLRYNTPLPPRVFRMILSCLTVILGAPFPLLRAVIATMFPKTTHPSEKMCYWSWSWIIALALSPFSWTRWTFWLSWYYGVLFLYFRPPLWALRLSSIGWLALWGQQWDPLALILGTFLEPGFLLILALGWVLLPAHLISPCWAERFWEILFSWGHSYSAVSICLPTTRFMSLLLIAPVLTAQTRTQIKMFEFKSQIFDLK